MSRSPQVSVVVPARDVSEYLPALLRDLQQQTFTDHEVIVVDDGSTDGTLEIITEFCDSDRRFQQLSSRGEGVSVARNVGIDAASGEFLAFADADDRVSPHYLARLHESITATGSDLASCNALRLEGYQTSPSVLHTRACKDPAVGTHLSRSPQLVWDTTVWNKLWRREMWDRAGIRYAEGRWLNDFYPCMRGHVASRTVDVLPDALYFWRIRTDPRTSITDSRLTDPVARLKSFDDRTFAIRSARRMVADELPVPRVLESFDYRLLRSDLPIYLPYYVGSDRDYRALLLERIGELLTEFQIRPQQFQLGIQLQLVYEAILSRDEEQLEALLHPETRIQPSQDRRQRTELALVGATASPAARRPSTPHGVVSHRVAKLARAAHLRQLEAPPATAAAQVDRIDVDPSQPTIIVVHGVVRLREGRSEIAGDWAVAACLESTRKMRGIGRLPGRLGRTARLIEQVRGPRTRILGPSYPLEPPPDEILHPLTRSGWRPFTARIDLAETLGHGNDPEWRLALHLRAGMMDLFPTAKIAKEASHYLPGGFHLGSETDLVPTVSKSGRLTLRRAPVHCQVVRAATGDQGLVVDVRFPRNELAPCGSPPVLWLQSPDRRLRAPEVEAGGASVAIPLPDLTDPAARYELWCRTAGGTGRARAHAKLLTARLNRPGADQPGEVVLRPTAQGRVVLEARPSQLDVSWMRADDTPPYLLIGGEGSPEAITRSSLKLLLACPWSDERIEVPIAAHPDGWQATIEVGRLAGATGDESRSWSLSVVKPKGGNVPLQIPAERRSRLPLHETVNGQSVQLRLSERSKPTLWVGQGQGHNRWRQLRKVQRSSSATILPAASSGGNPGGDAAAEDTGPADLTRPARTSPQPADIADLKLEAVLRRLTAPQASRSMTKVGPPSFREKMDERIRRRRFMLRYTDILPITEPLIHKPVRDRVLSMLGFPIPPKLLESGDLADVFKILQENDEAVVKPVSGATGKGVYLLRRSGSGWLNLRTETTLSSDELREKLETTIARRKPVTEWQVEQLVSGDASASGQPRDYKFYMFQGRHGLTVQMKRLPKRTVYKFYDLAWQPVDVGRDEERIDWTLPPPEDPAPLMDLAVRASQALPLSFIRIDLLIGRDSLYIGEVTPMPGRFHRFAESVDRELGLLWELAEFRYGPDFLTAEQFRPALSAIREVTGAERLYPD